MRGGSNHSQRIADRRAAVEIAAAPSAIPADRLACRRLQASSSPTPTNLSLRNPSNDKKVVPEQIYVQDGALTSAGVNAGIDHALKLTITDAILC